MEKATFAGGCFWCMVSPFEELPGIGGIVSGYAGGHIKNPTYEQVSTGRTGHAEVSQIIYDPSKISYAELLEVFWKMHDPTTLNRQGNDVGPQYRSAIFYYDASQKQEAEKYKAELGKAKVYPNPVVTEIVPAKVFYKAEAEHQNYFNLNGRQPYCRLVILPKVEKLEKVFKDKLKK